MSLEFAARIFVSLPKYHGTMFQQTVSFRSIPASMLSKKKFFAVSSGLSRETNPDSIARRPGASRR